MRVVTGFRVKSPVLSFWKVGEWESTTRAYHCAQKYRCLTELERRHRGLCGRRGKIEEHEGGDTVSTEAVAARRHAGTHLPVTWWKLEMPTTTWHLLLN